MKQKTSMQNMDPAEVALWTSDAADCRILRILAGTPLAVRHEPKIGLTMMTVTDGNGANFHLGEVLMTQAQVEYLGHAGYGAVQGNRPEKALVRAALEAVMTSDDEALKTRLIA